MVEEEFKKIAGFELPPVYINRLEEREIRKDRLFQRLSDVYFEEPAIFKNLLSSIDRWQKEEHSERTASLAGYLHYISEDYERAVQDFLVSISLCPENLDFWMDLAFSLYHCEDPLGYALIFNYDLFVHRYGKKRCPECTLDILQDIDKEIRAEGKELSQDFQRFLGK